MPRAQVRWKLPNTPQVPYQRRAETQKETKHTEEEWEEYKDKILYLFKTDTLADVTAYLNEDGFRVSETQVKNHLKKWGARKNLKLTDAQLDHVVERIAQREADDKKSAVRLNGEKVPSKKVEALLKKHPAKVEKVWLRPIPEEAPEPGDFDAETEKDPEARSLVGALMGYAATIIDSVRITVYTSSTEQGIRGPFHGRQGSENERTRKGLSGFSYRNLLPGNGGPGVTYKSFIKTMREGRDFEYPSPETWDDLILNTIGTGFYDFAPTIVQDTSGRRRLIAMEEAAANMVQKLPSGYKNYLLGGSERFKEFLKMHSEGKQIFRRMIDPRECPDEVWAVDMSSYIDWSSTPKVIDSSRWPQLCLAWCTRDAQYWNKWTSLISHVTSCGHGLDNLRSYSPVIFTKKLDKLCWELGGCQQIRLTSDYAKQDCPRKYMWWSSRETSAETESMEETYWIYERPRFWVKNVSDGDPEKTAHPAVADQLKWDALSLVILYPNMDKWIPEDPEDTSTLIFLSDKKIVSRFHHNISLRGLAGDPGRAISRLYFKPTFRFHPENGRRLFMPSWETLSDLELIRTPHWPQCLTGGKLQEYVKGVKRNFTEFLADHSGKVHIFRREIDMNDCPASIWAVDVSPLCSEYRRLSPQWFNGTRENSSFCLAWCTRDPQEWENWVTYLRLNHPRYHWFSCGHDLRTLAADGPVIFRITLTRKCWAQDGCQWYEFHEERVGEEPQSGSHDSITVNRHRTDMRWSKTRPRLEHLVPSRATYSWLLRKSTA